MRVYGHMCDFKVEVWFKYLVVSLFAKSLETLNILQLIFYLIRHKRKPFLLEDIDWEVKNSNSRMTDIAGQQKYAECIFQTYVNMTKCYQ